ncbi:hypothetical protein K491DRAFT_679816 [Lophiostoma macrostomum CBS 122681]|uniref:F-box domain-containing protein n=1 Tax=Lophiostoma macrostomum CBS 122681 TaxID=1314788 RepID=A0A6A6T5N4_9PLEO|nr:hypothetical protein K491DRAFT_679816 [Lophiostoma macrostomum CBS 122681]
MPTLKRFRRQRAYPSFLDLPLELRQMVYKHLDFQTVLHEIASTDKCHRVPIMMIVSKTMPLGILTTCRQIYEEASPILKSKLEGLIRDPTRLIVLSEEPRMLLMITNMLRVIERGRHSLVATLDRVKKDGITLIGIHPSKLDSTKKSRIMLWRAIQELVPEEEILGSLKNRAVAKSNLEALSFFIHRSVLHLVEEELNLGNRWKQELGVRYRPMEVVLQTTKPTEPSEYVAKVRPLLQMRPLGNYRVSFAFWMPYEADIESDNIVAYSSPFFNVYRRLLYKTKPWFYDEDMLEKSDWDILKSLEPAGLRESPRRRQWVKLHEYRAQVLDRETELEGTFTQDDDIMAKADYTMAQAKDTMAQLEDTKAWFDETIAQVRDSIAHDGASSQVRENVARLAELV